MSKINDGGPAFPNMGGALRGGDGTESGMSIRAYLAGQAVAGLNLEEWIDRVLKDESMNSEKAYGVIATYAVGVADALIAELNKETLQ